jgi:disulfide bond formation protein DsbB
LSVLTLLALIGVVLIAIVGLWERVQPDHGAERVFPFDGLWSYGKDSALGLAWIVALVASLGSLYLSEIAHYEPCTLCWLQRIAMYPLVAILGVGMLQGGRMVRWYALPLAGIGAGIAAYHALLQRVPGLQGATSCSAEAPCNFMWVREFGFVSIPVMALAGFLLIAALLFIAAIDDPQERKGTRRTQKRRL